MINKNELIERIDKFMNELGVPMTAFCRNIGVSTSAIAKWKKSNLELKESTLNRIDEYLCRYGF